MTDYKKSISVSNSADEVYKALTEHVQDWWSDDFSGSAAQNGDRYDIAFGETTKTFEIADAIPGQQVVWVCLKAYIDMDTLTKKDEWVGTRIIWTITENEAGTTLTVLHEGLNQTIECYDVCEPGWNYFIQSLYAFLTTGKGTPYLKKEGTLEWEDK